MTSTLNLFDDLEPAAPPPVASKAGVALISGHATAQKLSPEQQRFNRQLAELDKLKQQTLAVQNLADEFRPLFSLSLTPLRDRVQVIERDMVQFLHERLQRPGLTKTQRATADSVICGLCLPAAQAGDAQMQQLYDQHSPQSLQDEQQEDLDDTREMLRAHWGLDTSDIQADNSAELLDKAMQRLAQAEQVRAEKLAAKRSAKAAKTKADKAAQRAGTGASDADPADASARLAADANTDAHTPQSLLRNLYRQLARELHPDRESDEALRREKTDLMSQVNTAYARQDLATLLGLQLRVQQISPQTMALWSKAKIDSMNVLLKAQIKAAKDEFFSAQARLYDELQLPGHLAPDAASLRRFLAQEQQAWENTLHSMAQDLLAIQDDKALKVWLKDQRRISKDNARLDDILTNLGY